MLLAFLRILIHREHAEDNILVLDVAGLYELLESIPVLCGVLGIDIGVHLGLLELILHILLGSILALVSQLVVEVVSTLGRSEAQYVDVLDGQCLALAVDALEHLHELGDGVVLQLALTQVSLVDKELDLCLLLVGVDALEGVGSDAGTC